MTKSPHTRIHLLSLAFLVGALTLVAAGCGTEDNGPPPDYAKLTSDSKPPLKELYEQGNELIDGGQDAFDAQLEKVHGYPTVVNIWASWCGPCRAEFPHLQDAAAAMGEKVAFLGVNTFDSSDAARTFLDDNPLPYPSFSDGDRAINDDLVDGRLLPATAFFDAEGNKTYTKLGPYTSTEDLEADVKKYAINGIEG